MEIKRKNKEFIPVEIILETEKELEIFKQFFNFDDVDILIGNKWSNNEKEIKKFSSIMHKALEKFEGRDK